jgi:hypothetical protein
LRRNTSQAGGMDALVGALSRGNRAGYLDNPEMLAREATTEEGNSILGHIFGSKDVSRAVAGRAAEQTGIGADVLKKMLPVVATLVLRGLLSSLLDQNRDGSVADDVIGMTGRFLGGR